MQEGGGKESVYFKKRYGVQILKQPEYVKRMEGSEGGGGKRGPVEDTGLREKRGKNEREWGRF